MYEALALSLSAWPSLPTMRYSNGLRTDRYSPLSRLSSMFLCCSAVSDKVPCSEVGLGGVDGPTEAAMASSHKITYTLEPQQKYKLLVVVHITTLHFRKADPMSAHYPLPSHRSLLAAFQD